MIRKIISFFSYFTAVLASVSLIENDPSNPWIIIFIAYQIFWGYAQLRSPKHKQKKQRKLYLYDIKRSDF